MSLNAAQRRATRSELQSNLERSGLTIADLAAHLNRPEAAVRAAVAVGATDPVLVWAVRDLLEDAVRATGGEPMPYSVLTESARTAARGWFGVTRHS